MIEDLKIVKLRVYIRKVLCIELREKPVPVHTLAPRVFLSTNQLYLAWSKLQYSCCLFTDNIDLNFACVMYLLVTPSSLSFKGILIISKLPIANKNQFFTSKGPFTRTTKTLRFKIRIFAGSNRSSNHKASSNCVVCIKNC